jgi:hypothetical protein
LDGYGYGHPYGDGLNDVYPHGNFDERSFRLSTCDPVETLSQSRDLPRMFG